MFTSSQVATLNQEVTPEIEQVLFQMLCEKAMLEVKEWNTSVARMCLLEEDWEVKFNSIIDIQERMARGMKLIQSANKTISALWQRNSYAGLVWSAFSGKISDNRRANSILNHPNNKQLAQWFQYRARCWDKWNQLKDQCASIIGENTWLWGKYFDLADTEVNKYFCTGDSEDVDEQFSEKGLAEGAVQAIEMLEESHMKEEEGNLSSTSSIPSLSSASVRGLWDKSVRSSPSYDITSWYLEGVEMDKQMEVSF